MAEKTKCDYIVTNDILLDENYKDTLMNDLPSNIGKYKFIYVNLGDFLIVPTITNLSIERYSDAELIITGDTDATNTISYDFSNGYYTSGTFPLIVPLASIGDIGSVDIVATSERLIDSIVYTLNYVKTDINIVEKEMLFNNHIKIKISTNSNSIIFVKFNDGIEQNFQVGASGELEITSTDTELQEGVITISAIENQTGIGSMPKDVVYNFNEVDILINNDIIVPNESYFDGLDIGYDEIGVK